MWSEAEYWLNTDCPLPLIEMTVLEKMTQEQIWKMSPNYTDFKFSNIKSHACTKVSKSQMTPKATWLFWGPYLTQGSPY